MIGSNIENCQTDDDDDNMMCWVILEIDFRIVDSFLRVLLTVK